MEMRINPNGSVIADFDSYEISMEIKKNYVMLWADVKEGVRAFAEIDRNNVETIVRTLLRASYNDDFKERLIEFLKENKVL